MLKIYFKVMTWLAFIFVQLGIILPTLISSNDWVLYTLGWFIILILNPIIFWWVRKRSKQ